MLEPKEQAILSCAEQYINSHTHTHTHTLTHARDVRLSLDYFFA